MQINILNYYIYEQRHASNILYSLAHSAVLLSLLSLSSLTRYELKIVAGLTAVLHIPLLMFGLYQWLFNGEADINNRMQGLFPTAVWAELGLGVLICAFISEKKLLIATALAVFIAILYATQMRGVGLAAVLLLIGPILISKRRSIIQLRRLSTFVSIFILVLYFDNILSVTSDLLLLDNQYRGLGSGFSGRFDNWFVALDLYWISPVIGVGPGHLEAAYTHNGVLKLLAEYGAPLSIVFWASIFFATYGALLRRDAGVVSVLVCYLFFILTAPRYLNFQLMPYIALLVAANSLHLVLMRASAHSFFKDHDAQRW